MPEAGEVVVVRCCLLFRSINTYINKNKKCCKSVVVDVAVRALVLAGVVP